MYFFLCLVIDYILCDCVMLLYITVKNSSNLHVKLTLDQSIVNSI